ncbi:head-tail connector protein [Sulfitobacter sp. S190]|uniref:head-tail connector protein n=1 Tax=Sulfitobacter sp. S190 TaxID=2867022 RepID=UPI0021A7BF5D|nr:head-tail connector protein [Sulfitobacter sp. S190]UWR22629.1 head-tail connector protein [Sulfitobacter sp. S190]
MVTLAELRKQVRVEDGETYFNDDLLQCLEAAIDHLASIDVDMEAEPLPPAVKQATLMLAAHFFAHKEATAEEGIRFTPIGVDRLIAPYREVNL